VRLQLNLNNFGTVADRLSFSSSRTSAGAFLYDVGFSVPLLAIPTTPLSLHLNKAGPLRTLWPTARPGAFPGPGRQ
jgi:hypothetical protein